MVPGPKKMLLVLSCRVVKASGGYLEISGGPWRLLETRYSFAFLPALTFRDVNGEPPRSREYTKAQLWRSWEECRKGQKKVV